jgi:hypothetical protein
MDAFEKRKIFYPYRDPNPGPSSPQIVTIRTTLLCVCKSSTYKSKVGLGLCLYENNIYKSKLEMSLKCTKQWFLTSGRDPNQGRGGLTSGREGVLWRTQ